VYNKNKIEDAWAALKFLTDGTGWQFAVINGDTHAARWCEEMGRLEIDGGVNAIIPHLKPGDTVVDAGANIGAHTVPYAKAVGETGRVLAFEPNLPAYFCLAVNTRDLPQVQCGLCALGADFHTCSMVPNLNAGASCLSGRQHGEVDVFPLDALALTRCDFIKMDVEGFEPFLIRGAIQTLKKFHPLIFCELNDGALARYGFTKADIIKPLTDLGYRLEFLSPDHNLQMPQIDVFFLPA
jgi:FkbM family methyltransferase